MYRTPMQSLAVRNALPLAQFDRLHPSEYQAVYNSQLGLMGFGAWPYLDWSQVDLGYASTPHVLWDLHRIPRPVMIWSRLYPAYPPEYLAHRYPELRDMFSLRAVARRSYYLVRLHSLISQASVPERRMYFEALSFEQKLWMGHDRANLARRIEPNIQGPYGARFGCWTWRGRLKYGKPVMDWHGTQDVAVQRLLWTHFRPTEPLDDTMRPRRKADECSDDRCVNPWHFEYAVQIRTVGSGRTGPFRSDLEVPSPRPTWYAANAVQDENGDEYIECPNHKVHGPGVRLQGKAQLEFLNGQYKGRGYCPRCRLHWLSHGFKVTVDGKTRLPLSVSEIQEQAQLQQATNERARADQAEVDKAMRIFESRMVQPADPTPPDDDLI